MATCLRSVVLEKGANNYNDVMKSSGNKEITELMMKKGANDYNGAMIAAAIKGDKELVKIMIDFGANDYNGAMIAAAANGDKELIKIMIDFGANDYDGAMIVAAITREIDIIKMMVDLGANDFDKAFYRASELGRGVSSFNYFKVMELLIDLGAKKYKSLMEVALYEGDIELQEFLYAKTNIRPYHRCKNQ